MMAKDPLLEGLDELEEQTTEEIKTSVNPNAKVKRTDRYKGDDDDKPKKAGRPATGIKRSVFSASLDNELIEEINKLAEETGLSKTNIAEKALNLFMEEQAPFFREMLRKK